MLGMEERSRMKNLDRSTATPGFVTLTSVLLFTSSLVIGVSYAVPSQSPPSNLPAVKITAPNKGQQVPVASNILVSGTSFPPPSIGYLLVKYTDNCNDIEAEQKQQIIISRQP
jgi:hypothetical protein